jgi:hypothetical protein
LAGLRAGALRATGRALADAFRALVRRPGPDAFRRLTERLADTFLVVVFGRFTARLAAFGPLRFAMFRPFQTLTVLR